MPIDETELMNYISRLQDKENALDVQLGQIRLIRFNISKLKKRLVSSSIDQTTGDRVDTYDNPLDSDMGMNVVMTDEKRQSIYDANKTQADQVLN